MRKTLVIDIISALLLILFLYTGISKLTAYSRFRDALANSPLLAPYVEVISWSFPIVEVALAVLLFIPASRFAGLIFSLFLLCILTVYVIYMVLFIPKVPCSCGGVIEALSWKGHILFNLFFILIAATGIYHYLKHKRPRSVAPT